MTRVIRHILKNTTHCPKRQLSNLLDGMTWFKSQDRIVEWMNSRFKLYSRTCFRTISQEKERTSRSAIMRGLRRSECLSLLYKTLVSCLKRSLSLDLDLDLLLKPLWSNMNMKGWGRELPLQSTWIIACDSFVKYCKTAQKKRGHEERRRVKMTMTMIENRANQGTTIDSRVFVLLETLEGSTVSRELYELCVQVWDVRAKHRGSFLHIIWDVGEEKS